MEQSRLRFALVIPLFLCLLAAGSSAAEAPRHSLDHAFQELAADVPGFGGAFLDADGRLTTYLTDPGTAPGLETMGVRILKGDYDFQQLSAWRTEMVPALSNPDVVFLDVDERSNRVRIGVTPERAAATRRAVADLAAAAGVPEAAVIVAEVPPIHPVATVQDFVRPIPGGVQIHFPPFLCTLGWNAYHGEFQWGFVTNSHCTDNQGGVEGTLYYQNLFPNFVGTEVLDPPYLATLPGCPAGRFCRFSDSAYVRYDADDLPEYGRVARTHLFSITIDPANPRFRLTSLSSSMVGDRVFKVGRSTGMTVGRVMNTCVTVNVAQTNLTQLCQDLVENPGQTIVASGDSGSPVFATKLGKEASLRGILWGSAGGSLWVHSPVSSVIRELGRMRITDPLPPLSPRP